MAAVVCLVCRKGSARNLRKTESAGIGRYSVYLFDLDGTLLDSAPDICGAVQQVLSTHLPEALPFDYLRSYIGLHLDAVFTRHLPHYTRAQLDELIQDYRSVYLAREHAGTRVFPGAREALSALPGRKGTATTKGTPTTRAVLEKFELLPFFNHVQGTDGFPAKPEPDVILRCMEALAAEPGDCLMVGDSPADVAAARRAGIDVCTVRYGYGQFQPPSAPTPDFWISDLRELL